MSRSRKTPIIKDHPRNVKRSYWRKVRRVLKLKVHGLNEQNLDDVIIPQPREIIDDYDYCDYIIDYRNKWAGDEYTEKITRK